MRLYVRIAKHCRRTNRRIHPWLYEGRAHQRFQRDHCELVPMDAAGLMPTVQEERTLQTRRRSSRRVDDRRVHVLRGLLQRKHCRNIVHLADFNKHTHFHTAPLLTRFRNLYSLL
ncbi:hypothetical protein ANCCAN_02988 [Ancylostoma caninum]|uniref:Uncharacterized protein n=1 Tax=Ancylostoma caninum TaxID=29170 RepID=A0A368H6T5_ANCCA|nr:hypothetical protein ANCCAN_02988 [Ancylostoma caninum]